MGVEVPVCCPSCGSADDLQSLEQAVLWQSITGVHRFDPPAANGAAYEVEWGSTDTGHLETETIGVRCAACDWWAEVGRYDLADVQAGRRHVDPWAALVPVQGWQARTLTNPLTPGTTTRN